MIEYVCKYAPVEILSGFGEDAKILNPAAGNFESADKVVHSNVCSYSRSLIEMRLNSGSEPILLTSCCDSIERACDVLKNEGQNVYLLNLPHNNEHCSKIMYRSELIKFIDFLSGFLGREFSIEKFKGSFKANNEGICGPYIAVSGARMSSELFEFIRHKSGLPVKNNTCTSLRSLGQPPETDDFDKLISWYADELLSQPPCMRMTDISKRRELVNDPNLKGIIYNTVNFCDFYGFEYSMLKKLLNIPILKIETDYTTQGVGQMKTRLEAFFENIAGYEETEERSGKLKINSDDKTYYAGVDSGSTSTNAVVIDSENNIVSFSVIPTGVKVSESAQKALDEALKKANLNGNQICRTVATGYGRSLVNFRNSDVTEITCHAAGAHFLNPNVRTIIDIGGQDSKVIRLDENGGVKDFIMNDKCAAGTGRFIEMMAQSLGLTIEEISTKGLKWNEDITISSMCSVFAQSEVVSLIADDKRLEDIVHGLDCSIASKVVALGRRGSMEEEYMMTGGVARNKGVVRALEEKLGARINVPDEPDICGALGAALIAGKK